MISSLNIADLEAFAAVAEMRSIAKASTRLHLSQPAITRRLKNLEYQLGVKLFDRGARPMILTPEGEETHRHARNVLSTASELQAAITPGKKIKGGFRLGFSASLADNLLRRPLDILRREFPSLRLTVSSDESVDLLSAIRKLELDAAVILLPDGRDLPDGIAGEMLRSDTIAVAVPQDFHFPKGAKLTDLSRQPWIVNPLGCSGRQALQNAFVRAGLPLEIALEISGTGLQLALIEAGRGLGVFLPYVVKASRFGASIRIVRPPDFEPRLSTWIAYRPNSDRLKQPIQTLRDALKSERQASASNGR